MPEEKKPRRSRVLDYYEKKAETAPESGGDDPFQDLDAAFGLDGFGPKDDK